MWPTEFGGTPPKDCDAFHDLILIDELSRCAAGGVLWAVFFSFGIALPPVLAVGSQYLKYVLLRLTIGPTHICIPMNCMSCMQPAIFYLLFIVTIPL